MRLRLPSHIQNILPLLQHMRRRLLSPSYMAHLESYEASSMPLLLPFHLSMVDLCMCKCVCRCAKMRICVGVRVCTCVCVCVRACVRVVWVKRYIHDIYTYVCMIAHRHASTHVYNYHTVTLFCNGSFRKIPTRLTQTQTRPTCPPQQSTPFLTTSTTVYIPWNQGHVLDP